MGEQVDKVEGCFDLFSQWVKERGGQRHTSGIYSEPLIMWLMTYQRLNSGASLARAVDQLGQGNCWELAGECKRSKIRSASSKTGGYAQARAKISVDSLEESCDELFEWLKGDEKQSLEGRAYAIDGSTIELLRSKELLRKYPSHSKRGHYPLMRILVCHHLKSGLAVRPEHGAMYGKYRKGEIGLYKAMLRRLPKDAVLVGDRNFGIFAVAYGAKKAGLDVILRLQDHRAKKVLGRKPAHGIDQEVQWEVSSQDLRHNAELPNDSVVSGRVICMNVSPDKGGKVTPLYLFTTLSEPAEQIISMYGLRWQIEIDLRTLKQTVNMKMLNVESEDMACKELMVGISAYNLVRTVIRHAAERLGLPPRKFSFKRILYAVEACGEAYARASTDQERQWVLGRFWNSVDAAKHPNRKRKRIEPRAVVRHRRQKYPSLKGSRAQARAKILKKN